MFNVNIHKLIGNSFQEEDVWSLLDYLDTESGPFFLDFTGVDNEQIDYEAVYLLLSETSMDNFVKGTQKNLVEAFNDFFLDQCELQEEDEGDIFIDEFDHEYIVTPKGVFAFEDVGEDLGEEDTVYEIYEEDNLCPHTM